MFQKGIKIPCVIVMMKNAEWIPVAFYKMNTNPEELFYK
ncbi:hypothetical protein NIASO_15590 [Niabella soli DSM 19437]|uniref:Uncharacterized protein n=1 Tax=Niabella soli DSM 19437 TaxID=929713 RepID=W0F7S5_9BACT|nr:hypothetical protein NIASO_15590 [Niabella soli DSM 19437]